jgi:general secretion pathway protein I
MPGAYIPLTQVATTSISLREKTLASWIARNVVTEYSVQTEWPTLGDRDEEIEYAGLTWLLTIQVSETEVQNLRRVDVSVALEDRPQRIIHKVSGLVEPPMSADFPPVEWREVGRSPRG